MAVLPPWRAVIRPWRGLKDQRVYLIEVAKSESRIADIEERIPATYRRYQKAIFVFFFGGLLAGGGCLFAVGIYLSAYHPSVVDSYIGFLLVFLFTWYPVWFLSIYIGVRSSPEYSTFDALVTCIRKVDGAVGKPYASKERKALASQVLSCARRMRSYRSLVPLRMHKRVMSKEAVRASQYLKEFVYPAMFGSDRELAKVKKGLALAAISVGTRNWTQVGGGVKAVTVSRRTNASAATAWLVPLLTASVPFVTALVTAVAAFAPSQSTSPAASTPGPSASPSGTTAGPSGTPTGTRTPSPQAGSGR
jgi:type IV secretory pathway TrbD component